MRHQAIPSRRTYALALALALTLVTPLRAQVIEYLGNEGVRIELGDVTVLIDALWDNDHGEYERVPPGLLAEITAAKGRFGEVDYFLASHWHGDHFDAAMVANYMKKNEGCTFISSRQVVETLRRSPSWDAKLEERVIEVEVELGESLRVLNLERGSIDATWLLHSHRANRDVVNLAFRVESANRSIVHTGDTDSRAATAFLSDAKADVALVAFWEFLGAEGSRTIDGAPGVKKFLAMHVPVDTSSFDKELAAVKGLVVLNEPGEVVGR